ncbi:MAG: hypothetical protein K8I60_07140, partial [Anaerolineae bacterium]|nr:hypothetical protein [Anaerolineae bacterium]
MPIAIVIILVLVLVGGLVYVGLREDKSRDPLQERLAQFADKDLPESLEEIEMSIPFRDRVLLPILRKPATVTTKFTPEKQLQDVRHQIELAGMSGSMEPTSFLAMRIGATLAFAFLAFMVFFVLTKPSSNSTVYVVGGAGLGYFLPTLWIKGKISRRQENILK